MKSVDNQTECAKQYKNLHQSSNYKLSKMIKNLSKLVNITPNIMKLDIYSIRTIFLHFLIYFFFTFHKFYIQNFTHSLFQTCNYDEKIRTKLNFLCMLHKTQSQSCFHSFLFVELFLFFLFFLLYSLIHFRVCWNGRENYSFCFLFFATFKNFALSYSMYLCMHHAWVMKTNAESV